MYIYGSFASQRGETITVHIVTQSDRTEELEIGAEDGNVFFSDDPVEIESAVNDTFDHLIRSSATIHLLTREYIPDLFCTSCRDAVVNIYKGDRCVFAGYIEPQTYSQGYNAEFEELEISCVDALSALQYSKYRNIGTTGNDYAQIKADAAQRTFYDYLNEILLGVTTDIDIVGESDIRYLYDGSKAIDSSDDNKYSIFSQLSISELLFLDEEEDDVWQQDAVLEEILRYLNLHIVQEGFDFFIFTWESVKGTDDIAFTDLISSETATVTPQDVEISIDNVADTATTISIGEVFNQILLTCEVVSTESVIESPLDDDLLVSPFSNKQKYMTEYSSNGEGTTAWNAFINMVYNHKSTDWEESVITDWFMQIMRNERWIFYINQTDISSYFTGTNQQKLLNVMVNNPAAAIISFGKVETRADKSDNSPTSKVDMTNYLVISVNGNEDDTEDGSYPTEDALKENIPYAVYNGNTSGGVFSPTDDETTNYIVISGKIALNPIMKVTGTYEDLQSEETVKKLNVFHKLYTVPSRDNEDGRYYTRRWWKASTPASEVEWDEGRTNSLIPFTNTGPQEYEFKYSAIGESDDTVSKIAVLACMLIIGDKCVVETGTDGQISDFEWRTYKTLEECDSEDEYYQQCFTIGFDPKIGDCLIGTEFDMQNNIDYTLGIDAEGIAIPITKADAVSGAVKFMILGPVNTMWDDITRRHPTFFRRTKWTTTSVPLLAHVSNIVIKSFEMEIYSDNGLINNTTDKDIVYMSDTNETFVNKKDDITFKINSALTSAECLALGVTESVKMSTPMNETEGAGVLTIYDAVQKLTAKPEQLYVDSYYREFHEPRLLMEQHLNDDDSIISLFNHYTHPTLGKTFFVQGIGRSLIEGRANLSFKEIEND